MKLSRRIIWTQTGEADEVVEKLNEFAEAKGLCVCDISISSAGGVTEVWADVSGNQFALDELDTYAYLRLAPDPN